MNTGLSWSLWGKDISKVTYLIGRYSFSRIDFKPLIEAWSRMTITHYILKIVKTFFMDQTKLIHLDDIIMNYVLNGYPIHRKGYEMLGGESE